MVTIGGLGYGVGVGVQDIGWKLCTQMITGVAG